MGHETPVDKEAFHSPQEQGGNFFRLSSSLTFSSLSLKSEKIPWLLDWYFGRHWHHQIEFSRSDNLFKFPDFPLFSQIPWLQPDYLSPFPLHLILPDLALLSML